MDRFHKESSLRVRSARALLFLSTPRGKRRVFVALLATGLILTVFMTVTLPGTGPNKWGFSSIAGSGLVESEPMTPADAKSLDQVAHADPQALEECLANWATTHSQSKVIQDNADKKESVEPIENSTGKNGIAVEEILGMASSGAVTNDNSVGDAQAIASRARGNLNNHRANVQSINQAHAIVKDVEREIASAIIPETSSDSSSSSSTYDKVADPSTILDESHIVQSAPKLIDLKFPGSSVGTARQYGFPLFGYLGRERGNFEGINDHIAPRSELLRRRRGLLAIPVSDNAKEQLAPVLAKFRQEKFDVMLFHYDLSDWSDVPYYNETISIRVIGQTKFWFAKRFLVPELMENYDYIFLWDDDVGLTPDWSPTKFVSILQHYSIHAAQPALDKGARNNYPQYETVRLHRDVVEAGLPGRFADFVEVMFPVFSREAWQNCIWETIPYDGRSFWGVDNAWYPHCSSMGYCRFAVIDVMPVDHLDKKSLYQPAQNNMREFGFYTRLYRNMCTTKPTDVDRPTMFRIFVICNFLRRRPLGWSFRSLMSIDTVIHGGPINSTTCPEPTLWPRISNRPWYGDQPSRPVPYKNGVNATDETNQESEEVYGEEDKKLASPESNEGKGKEVGNDQSSESDQVDKNAAEGNKADVKQSSADVSLSLSERTANKKQALDKENTDNSQN